jgi:hypothetical protein
MIEETPKGISFLQSNSGRPTDLVRRWCQQAAQYDRDGHLASARILQRVADELEVITGGESVTLAEAARRSGYTTDHLARLDREGKLRNVGRKHAPRYLVVDLPRKLSRMPEKSDIVATEGDVLRERSGD